MGSTIFMTTMAVPFYYSHFRILMVILCNTRAKAHAAIISQHNYLTKRYGIDTKPDDMHDQNDTSHTFKQHGII